METENRKPNDLLSPKTMHRPWRRFFARYIDIHIFTIFAGLFIGFQYPNSSLNQNQSTLALASLLGWAFIEVGILSTFGETPSKALYGIKLVKKGGGNISFLMALLRGLAVWGRGLAMGMPLSSFITIYISYRNLINNGATIWDKGGGFEVLHSDLNSTRLIIATFVIIGFFALDVFSFLTSCF